MKTSKFSLLFLFLVFSLAAYAQKKDEVVYVTRTGAKYHLSTCQYVKQDSAGLHPLEAEKKGYTPCSVCKPAENNVDRSQKVTSTPVTVKSGTSRQCSGKTKKGARCQRMTTSANGRCYQH